MPPTGVLERLQWDRDGLDWPNREASRFVTAGGLRWHLQELGNGAPMLLLHGSGAATHSWRDLAPLLAEHFRVISMDLPGHGFSTPAPAGSLSLPGIARSLAALLEELGVQPAYCVGHSAGAALGAYMAMQGLIAPRLLVSLNGAHLPLRGLPGWFYAPVAQLISDSRSLPRLMAWRARNRAVVERLLRGTGSRLDARGFEFYWRLARSPGHVSAALGLMAGWDVRLIERGLPSLSTPIFLLTGSNDQTVPPADSLRVLDMAPNASWQSQPGLGHLAHEEQPAPTADLIRAAIARQTEPVPAARSGT